MADKDRASETSQINRVNEECQGENCLERESPVTQTLICQQNRMLLDDVSKLIQHNMTQHRLDVENMMEEKIANLELRMEGKFKRQSNLRDDIELMPPPKRARLEDQMNKLSIGEHSVQGRVSTAKSPKKLAHYAEQEIKEKNHSSEVVIRPFRGENSGKSKRRPRDSIQCYRCGVMGHFVSSCPMKGVNGCYNCGMEGHKWNECPRLQEVSKGVTSAKAAEIRLQSMAERAPKVPLGNPTNREV